MGEHILWEEKYISKIQSQQINLQFAQFEGYKNTKSTNSIKPEKIAEEILNQFDIKFDYRYESVFFGQRSLFGVMYLLP